MVPVRFRRKQNRTVLFIKLRYMYYGKEQWKAD